MNLDPATRLARRPAQRTGPVVCSLLGRDWDVLRGVHCPADDFSTAYFTAHLPYGPGPFLEMGCGAGVTAITAALQGSSQVMAVDVSAAAVRNTELNARRHGVADTVRAVHSDLFTDVPAGEYDVIFWNSSFVDAPAPEGLPADLARIVFDPGYSLHRRYLHEAQQFLPPCGRLLLGFGSLGNHDLLERLAGEAGLRPVVRDSVTVPGPARLGYSLIELVRTGGAG
ncbi:methyltransferase [Actinoplanes sp. N902-109]|uniref:methyltransferase n=1 Tax=Actinoplanes sp. (strain N902-109) TaxID=649831 RepID=UPI0003294D10|nr:methyltransferase [Actinoplanes sp. N902-109]AGL16383.1 methylase of polypeptide chain release factors-like protein [Actinoplanes sp. N902-109]